ncbi:MAG TPA: dethiobiotin synthase [Polyangiaceae bacterium]|jgi:dethiobiotin synthetase
MTQGCLIVVTGTGTEIGKTHVSESLLVALGREGLGVAGLKPVESGVGPGGLSDADRLSRASTFHVKRFTVGLRAPVSPHLAARIEGVHVDLDLLRSAVRSVLGAADAVLVELPGGLFTPLTDDVLNVDFARSLAPDLTLLVAPDRLGVLHDVLATSTAATSNGLRLDALVLVEPASHDASTGTNAAELRRLSRIPVVVTLPRGGAETVAGSPAIRLMARLVRSSSRDPAPA